MALLRGRANSSTGDTNAKLVDTQSTSKESSCEGANAGPKAASDEAQPVRASSKTTHPRSLPVTRHTPLTHTRVHLLQDLTANIHQPDGISSASAGNQRPQEYPSVPAITSGTAVATPEAALPPQQQPHPALNNRDSLPHSEEASERRIPYQLSSFSNLPQAHESQEPSDQGQVVTARPASAALITTANSRLEVAPVVAAKAITTPAPAVASAQPGGGGGEDQGERERSVGCSGGPADSASLDVALDAAPLQPSPLPQKRQQRLSTLLPTMSKITRGAVGLFHPQLYLSGGNCIECGNEMMSRGKFERLAGTATAKWHVSIKVLPSGVTLGKWLQQHGLPILQGRPRRRRADSVEGDDAADGPEDIAMAESEDEDGGEDVSDAVMRESRDSGEGPAARALLPAPPGEPGAPAAAIVATGPHGLPLQRYSSATVQYGFSSVPPYNCAGSSMGPSPAAAGGAILAFDGGGNGDDGDGGGGGDGRDCRSSSGAGVDGITGNALQAPAETLDAPSPPAPVCRSVTGCESRCDIGDHELVPGGTVRGNDEMRPRRSSVHSNVGLQQHQLDSDADGFAAAAATSPPVPSSMHPSASLALRPARQAPMMMTMMMRRATNIATQCEMDSMASYDPWLSDEGRAVAGGRGGSLRENLTAAVSYTDPWEPTAAAAESRASVSGIPLGQEQQQLLLLQQQQAPQVQPGPPVLSQQQQSLLLQPFGSQGRPYNHMAMQKQQQRMPPLHMRQQQQHSGYQDAADEQHRQAQQWQVLQQPSQLHQLPQLGGQQQQTLQPQLQAFPWQHQQQQRPPPLPYMSPSPLHSLQAPPQRLQPQQLQEQHHQQQHQEQQQHPSLQYRSQHYQLQQQQRLSARVHPYLRPADYRHYHHHYHHHHCQEQQQQQQQQQHNVGQMLHQEGHKPCPEAIDEWHWLHQHQHLLLQLRQQQQKQAAEVNCHVADFPEERCSRTSGAVAACPVVTRPDWAQQSKGPGTPLPPPQQWQQY
ncbi:RegA-like protein RlsJ [Volvox carteri f. nagariensis]|uniref:RegA-like protein RlsJ n=1 Tax=Volvox carteri f. nagariensis TaxID=3068 RepID=D8THE5_VOLCA|nr:RegA-like protein RlsJ [Volvox carteri f. nagariensis]EFJ52698.1 RegA-like protein RlsJ [Volvox carteri f. nagariensis]|eukprot:XP_002945703.1 RegA-like protein RlsJ [Volvox carteri f. nagariensis]